VPPEVASAVVSATDVPVIGCGAGPACHGYVFVTHDAFGLTQHTPRFAPKLGDLATPALNGYREYVRRVTAGEYPAADNDYEMPREARDEFLQRRQPVLPQST
jgi:3-methyl-2-oxobutanoate hydroxymethyltransferase